MNIREIIATDTALYADMRESLRRGSVSIVYESESVLITLENDWKMYTVAAADLEEAKRKIEELNEEDTFFVVHDAELKDFLCDCLGYSAGEACVQSVYTKPEPPKVERRLEIRHPDEADFAYVQANYHMGDGYELYNDFKSDDFFAGYLDGRIIGFIGLHSEGSVGLLHIDKAHREKGFGYEMAAFMLAHQMEKGRIPYGQIYESNKASLELNASLGMELSEGRLYWVTNMKFE